MSLPLPRFCKSCAYCEGWPGAFLRCMHQSNLKTSLVTELLTPVHSIDYCREDGHCGPSGEHYVAIADAWHDDKPKETVYFITTDGGDQDTFGRPMKAGT